MRINGTKTKVGTQEAIRAALQSGAAVFAKNLSGHWVAANRVALARSLSFTDRMQAEGHGRAYQWRSDLYRVEV